MVEGVAIGFPYWKIRVVQAGRYRASAHVPGRIAAGANTREDACELIVDPPAPRDGSSPWVGMSGAPVFCGDVLVGVVTDHHPAEGLNRLSVARLDRCLAGLPDPPDVGDRAEPALSMLGLASATDVRPLGERPWAVARRALTEQIGEILPNGGLRDRADELRRLREFCAGAAVYGLWQGRPWAGKTALMAAFALDSPTGVTVVPYFVTARLSGANNSREFLRSINAQLAGASRREDDGR